MTERYEQGCQSPLESDCKRTPLDTYLEASVVIVNGLKVSGR